MFQVSFDFFDGQNIFSRAYYWLHSTVLLVFYGLHSLSGKYYGCVSQKLNLCFQKVIKCTIFRNVSSKFRFFQRPKHFQGLLLAAFDSPIGVLWIAFAFREILRLRFAKAKIYVFKKL